MDAGKQSVGSRRKSCPVHGCMASVAFLVYFVVLLLITRGREVSAIVSSKRAPAKSPLASIHRNSSTVEYPLASVHGNSSTLISPPEWMTVPLFHSPRVFAVDYADMKANLKIFIYPYTGSNGTLDFGGTVHKGQRLPQGSYASEPFLFRNLHESEFRTYDPNKAHFFSLPFSPLNLRIRLGVKAVPERIRKVVEETVRQKWPYWNRTGGADHFYFTCHDIGAEAAEKTPHLSASAIQIICPASRWKRQYFPTKDFSFPQIWPHYDAEPGGLSAAERKASKVLAFWSGSQNSKLRKVVWETWADDDEILLGGGRVLKKKTKGKDYFSNFRKAKYCLHVTGFQVHTARIGDAIYFGCVPVILSDQYDLPFGDLLDWNEFAVIVAEGQVRQLKNVLKSISDETYQKLHKNVETIRRLFTWNSPPQDYDTFHLIMYDLWLRRFVLRPPLDQDIISRSPVLL